MINGKTFSSNGIKHLFIEGLIVAFLIIGIGCQQREGFYTYSIASPDGKQCLTFAGEFDEFGRLKNNCFYLLGFNTNELNKLPDSNYVALKHYSAEMDGVNIFWGEPIRVRNIDAFENKLNNKNIDFKARMQESEIKELKKHMWKRYDLRDIYQEKYADCD